jgi:hypothetical protein
VNFNEKGFDNDWFLSLSAAMRNFCLQYDKNSRGRQNGEIQFTARLLLRSDYVPARIAILPPH